MTHAILRVQGQGETHQDHSTRDRVEKMTLNVDALVMDYVQATTDKEKENIVNTVPLFMLNTYLRTTLEKLHHEHNTLQFPAYNMRDAGFKRNMKFALEHNVTPRGFIH